jgi:hemerythrin-like domain-containing protein
LQNVAIPRPTVRQDTTMNTTKTKTKKTGRSGKRGGSKLPAAIAMLDDDHKAVDKLFKRYEKAGEGAAAEKRELLREICSALTVHAQIEEELFYPELRAALDEEDVEMLDEATVEHASLKDLIAQLEDAEPGDDLVDARVKVLSEYVKHHVEEERNEIFPEAKKAKGLDLDDLAERMAARKAELEGAEEGAEASRSVARSPRRETDDRSAPRRGGAGARP